MVVGRGLRHKDKVLRHDLVVPQRKIDSLPCAATPARSRRRSALIKSVS